MNDEQEFRCRQAIEKYATWLTMWCKTDDPQSEITVDNDFYGLYGSRRLLADYDDGYYRVMHFVVDYGDDGGASELVCFFDDDPDDTAIRHIEQIFDTMIQPIFDATNDGRFPDGLFLNVPGVSPS